MRITRSVLLPLVLSLFATTARVRPAPAQSVLTASTTHLLRMIERPGSLRNLAIACLMDHIAQGLAVSFAVEACALSVAEAAALGGRPPLDSLPKAGDAGFDPDGIVVSCGTGDPRRSAPSFDGMTTSEVYRYMEHAKAMRAEAVKAGDKRAEQYWDTEASRAFEELEKRDAAGAEEGGNAPAVPNVRPMPDASDSCYEVLARVREILRECAYAGYAGPCIELGAKLRGCPNPLYAYVVPGEGLACEDDVDREALMSAWQARCEQLTTPGPDDGSPCSPPEVSEPGVMGGTLGDLCNDPRALVDPFGDTCVVPLEVRGPGGIGENDLQALILIGWRRLGGPIIVLPTTGGPPPFPPGTDPRPGPR